MERQATDNRLSTKIWGSYRPQYARQEYLTLAGNRQVTYNPGRTVADPPMPFTFPWILDTLDKLLLIPHGRAAPAPWGFQPDTYVPTRNASAPVSELILIPSTARITNSLQTPNKNRKSHRQRLRSKWLVNLLRKGPSRFVRGRWASGRQFELRERGTLASPAALRLIAEKKTEISGSPWWSIAPFCQCHASATRSPFQYSHHEME